jgi:hypothetical protein
LLAKYFQKATNTEVLLEKEKGTEVSNVRIEKAGF